jgi:hypothetical protein
LTKPNFTAQSSCQRPYTSDGVRDHPRNAVRLPSELAFSLAGIPRRQQEFTFVEITLVERASEPLPSMNIVRSLPIAMPTSRD